VRIVGSVVTTSYQSVSRRLPSAQAVAQTGVSQVIGSKTGTPEQQQPPFVSSPQGSPSVLAPGGHVTTH
jgi:hypothetical protein